MGYDYYITPEEYERAASYGVDGFTLERRVRLLGWKKERAITTPIRKITNRKHWVKIVAGRRVPLSGAQKGFENDVEVPTPIGTIRAEVKRRKSGFSTLYGWLEDERERPDIVAFRDDRKPWLVAMPVEVFQRLIGRDSE